MKVVYAERARRVSPTFATALRGTTGRSTALEDVIRATCEGLSDFPYASVATNEPNVRRRVPLVRVRATLLRLSVSFTARA